MDIHSCLHAGNTGVYEHVAVQFFNRSVFFEAIHGSNGLRPVEVMFMTYRQLQMSP